MTAATGDVDFVLPAGIRLRVRDATTSDRDAVRRQVGLAPVPAAGEADLTVRFVAPAAVGPLTLVDVHESGFDADGFVVLRAPGGVPTRVRLPFERLGERPEIVCESGVPAVPHLIALVNLTAISRGVLPLHATAFTCDGLGILVTGWSKSGKTETLLAAAGLGARYVGDEWVYLTADGRMTGVPEPVRLWDWHLAQLPEVRARLTGPERAAVAGWRTAARVAGGARRLPAVAGPARRGQAVLGRQASVRVPPERLFGADRIEPSARLDALVLLLCGTDPATRVETVDAREVAQRMTASLEEERAPLLAAYRQFRYAFPGRRSALLEDAGRLEARLLHGLLDDRDARSVTHPYPCDIATLGAAVVAAARACAPLAAGRSR